VVKSKSKNNFTWERQGTFTRLDRIYCSQNLHNLINNYQTTWRFIKTDHALVTLELIPNTPIDRGGGFPKLYATDIATKEAKLWVRNALSAIESEIPGHWSPHMILEFYKMTLRSKVQELRALKKKVNNKVELQSKLDNLISNSSRTGLINSGLEIDDLKNKITQLEEEEQEKLRIMAGVKWREQGEKSTKFFLRLIKQHQATKTMEKIRNSEGNLVSSPIEILEAGQMYYKELYKKVESDLLDETFFDKCPTIDRDIKHKLDSPITLEEFRSTLKSCRDSAPGLDGIPYSYYKVFGDILIPRILDSWNYSLTFGSLAPSHRQACISLLPKTGKDLTELKNWRPISLTACDLKVITKTISNRLKPALQECIFANQAAYVPGRDINFNNRLLLIAKRYAEKYKKDYCSVSLDAQKAFDSVSHQYLRRVLREYGFSETFVDMFNTIYNRQEAVVQINGHLSKPFALERGVKQGDALSCSLFVLAMDPLLRNIQDNQQIRGLHIPITQNEEIEIKVLAYADDVNVICRNSNSILHIFHEYERLSVQSGLNLNADKTEIFNFIASRKTSNIVRYLNKRYDLKRCDSVKVCGLTISKDERMEYDANVTSKIEYLKRILQNWSQRSLSINGRMIIAKTFAASQIVYTLQSYAIRNNDLKTIEKAIYAFVNGRKDSIGPETIARKLLKAPKSEGGINGIDIESFANAICTRTYAKAANNHRELGKFQASQLSQLDAVSMSTHASMNKLLKKTVDIEQNPQNCTLISGLPLSIALKGGTKALEKVHEYNLRTINDLCQARQNRSFPRGQINKIIRAIPNSIKPFVTLDLTLPTDITISIPNNEQMQEILSLSSQKVQRIFMGAKRAFEPVNLSKIYKDPGMNSSHDWCSNLWLIKSPILRSIRLKIMYKNVYSNERRFRFGLTNSPNCQICGQVETVHHQLYDCRNANALRQMVFDSYNLAFENLETIIIPGRNTQDEIIKSVLLKMLIQIDRSAGISEGEFKSLVNYYERIEQIVAEKRE
jgi:hypothetical protein